MKQKMNARQKRDAEALRRRGALPAGPARTTPKPPEAAEAAKPPVRKAEPGPAQTPEEETREFLEYLDRYDVPADKEEPSRPSGKRAGTAGELPKLNLEDGMPVVSEALDRMRLGLQEMRHSRVRAVKLIHGYGSTGRGGKINAGVRKELAAMKRNRQIRDFIPGEDFGPTDPASRSLAERDGSITRDRDYGRMNHGITVVVL